MHDESACNANDRLKFQYVHTSKSATLRSKSNGAGLMTSAFITEVLAGIMQDAAGVAAETLEYGKGVWWNSARMLAQLRKVVAIRNRLFPWARCIWRFDHSSNHKAKADDALNVFRMSIGPGGKQPLMRSTTVLDECLLKGQVQALVFEAPHPRAGQAKGLKQVLDERWGPAVAAAFTGRTRKKQLQQRLLQDQDFGQATTLIHDLLPELCPDDLCRFYPKFHCEFSPIERFWADHKRFCRTYCKGNIIGLRKVVPQGLDAVCGDSVQRYFGLCRRYEAAYRLLGVNSTNVDTVVRAYTSHRKVLPVTLETQLIQSLGASANSLIGHCHCLDCIPVPSTCTQSCCSLPKPSACTSPRCAVHGSVRGDDGSTPSGLAALEKKQSVTDDEKEEDDQEEPHTLVSCRLKACRRWRRVPLAWFRIFNRGNEQFTCDAASQECESKCHRCNNKACKCRCKTCEKGKSCVCECPVCAQRINECTCAYGDESDGQDASQAAAPGLLQDVDREGKEPAAPKHSQAALEQKNAATKQQVASTKRRRLAGSSASEDEQSSSSSPETSEKSEDDEQMDAAPGLPRQGSLATTNPRAALAELRKRML